MKRLLAILLCLMLVMSGLCESGEVLDYLTGGEKLNQWIDASLAPEAGSGADHTALAIAAIDRDALLKSEYGKSLSSYVRNNHISNPATALRIALTLAACGEDAKQIESLLDSSVGKGIMSDVYALLVIGNGYTCKTMSERGIVEEVLSLQLPDGGWAISGKVSDADTTAMTLQALTAYEDETVAEARDRAIALLCDIQTENGGYKSYGAENCESACQVLIALTCLGIDPATDQRFIKNGHTILDAIEAYRLESGAYSHLQGGRENTMAARQVLLAYAAYEKMSRGEGDLYRYEMVKKEAHSLKFYLNIALSVLCLMVFVMLIIAGRRRRGTFLCVFILFAAVLAAINVLDIRGVNEYYAANEENTAVIGSVNVEIRCDNIIGKKENIPADGSIFSLQKVELLQDDTAASVLRRVCKQNKIRLDMDNSMASYVTGIDYLYELEFGPLSGWIYKVNGERLSVGCGECEVKDGDTLSFLYTLDLGEDCN